MTMTVATSKPQTPPPPPPGIFLPEKRSGNGNHGANAAGGTHR
jgi:hypothetical protein